MSHDGHRPVGDMAHGNFMEGQLPLFETAIGRLGDYAPHRNFLREIVPLVVNCFICITSRDANKTFKRAPDFAKLGALLNVPGRNSKICIRRFCAVALSTNAKSDRRIVRLYL